MAALWISVSTHGCVIAIRAISVEVAIVSDRSTTCVSTPSVRSPYSSRSIATTVAPASLKARAMAWPRPAAAPVTTTV